MTEIIRKYGLNHIQMAEELTRSIGVDRIQVDGQGLDGGKQRLRHRSAPTT